MTTAAGAESARGLAALSGELAEAFRGGVEPWPEDRFERLALRVFAWQFAANPVYRRFAEGRGATPDTVRSWTDVPAVPAAAFKHLPLVSGDPARVERVFRTSGTSHGRLRGQHHVPDLALYRASLLPGFRAHVLPDGPMPFLSLIAPPEAVPDSSLSTMVGTAMSELGAPGSAWFGDGERLDFEGFERALRALEASGRPVLLLGTAFAFVHWLDRLAAHGAAFRLPAGSRVLETGGFKGRSRTVPREELYASLAERLGIGAEWIVNEYGMTELLSQYYEAGVGKEPAAGVGLAQALAARRLVPPPWLRFRILDPMTLAPLPDGERGLVAHFDLANVGSVAAVLTEDVGRRDGAGLELFGRSPGAEPRGCSVAMDELLGAAER